MFLFPSQYIGIDLRKGNFRLAILRKSRRGWNLSLTQEGSEGDFIQGRAFKEAIVVSALNVKDILTRPCEIPLKKNKDIFAALNFHVEPLLPYPIDNAITQAQIVARGQDSTFITLTAVRKDRLKNHLDSLGALSVHPDSVTTKAHALAALSTFFPQSNTPHLLVHQGEEELSFILVEKGVLLAARSIDIKKEGEIPKILLNLFALPKAKQLETLYFFGQSTAIKKILQEGSEGKMVLLPLSPFPNLTQEQYIHFSLAIGSAMADSKINFRQKEFAHPHRFKHLKKPLIAFFSLSLLLSGTLLGFTHLSIEQKKLAIEEGYRTLLRTEKLTSLESFEPQSADDYLMALSKAGSAIQGVADTFPLHPQVPKVKEVLGWLNSLSGGQGKEHPPIQIESIHYQMVKRPDFSNRQEKYKVRVDLELSAENAHTAKIFHESLKNSASLIDLKEEVQWLSAKGKYKASFFLKDKTKYK